MILTVRNTVSREFGLCQSVYKMGIVSIIYLDLGDLWAVALLVTLQFKPAIGDTAVGRA